jgi:hypothetical protein
MMINAWACLFAVQEVPQPPVCHAKPHPRYFHRLARPYYESIRTRTRCGTALAFGLQDDHKAALCSIPQIFSREIARSLLGWRMRRSPATGLVAPAELARVTFFAAAMRMVVGLVIEGCNDLHHRFLFVQSSTAAIMRSLFQMAGCSPCPSEALQETMAAVSAEQVVMHTTPKWRPGQAPRRHLQT